MSWLMTSRIFYIHLIFNLNVFVSIKWIIQGDIFLAVPHLRFLRVYQKIFNKKLTYIFRWHNFFEFVQGELFLSFAHIFSEYLLKPANILLVQYTTLPKHNTQYLIKINKKFIFIIVLSFLWVFSILIYFFYGNNEIEN